MARPAIEASACGGQSMRFTIVPPRQMKYDSPSFLEYIRAGLTATFPGHEFIVTTEGRNRYDDEFFLDPSGQVDSLDFIGKLGFALPELTEKPPTPALTCEIKTNDCARTAASSRALHARHAERRLFRGQCWWRARRGNRGQNGQFDRRGQDAADDVHAGQPGCLSERPTHRAARGANCSARNRINTKS